MLTIGLAGAGGIARPHLRAYVESEVVTAVAIADPSEQARAAIQSEFGIIKAAHERFEALLEDPEIPILDLCTPHYLHKPQAIAALEAGKDVILEKPMAMSVAECDEMLAVAERTGRRLFVSMNQRMFPAHIEAKKLLEAEEIGRVFLGVINVFGNEMYRMLDPESWKGDWERAGGGALFDTGYHAVYMMQHFLGTALTVTAATKRLLSDIETKADDTSVVALDLPDTTLGAITVTYGATGDRWTEERRIVGTNGSLLIRDDPEDGMPLLLLRRDEIMPVPMATPMHVNPYAIARTLDHFLDCILHDRPEQITAAEARAAVGTCQAAYASEREGRRVPVEL